MVAIPERRHPLDSAGLVLPEPSWPDPPGSAGVLEPLRRFCNTTNRENGADAWRTPLELADWLGREGYGRIGWRDRAALAWLVELREALWNAISTEEWTPFTEASGVVTLQLEATGSGVRLAPVQDGVDAVVARLVIAVVEARAGGELDRLKCCRHCRWVFHDASKNRSGRWCSMAACGGRSKARAYRRRRADDTASPRSEICT